MEELPSQYHPLLWLHTIRCTNIAGLLAFRVELQESDIDYGTGQRLNAHFSYITNQETLHQLCDKIAAQKLVAFDTEFVAEDSYRPELCLVQVATEDEIAIIDPYACGDLNPFWQSLIDPATTVIVHAGREETLFCYRATQSLIPNLFDIQIAAAFLGFEYPASYGNLVHRFTGMILDKDHFPINSFSTLPRMFAICQGFSGHLSSRSKN